MDTPWQQAMTAYARLQLRERYMVLFASSLLLIWFGLLYLLEPAWQQLQQMRLEQQQLQTATSQLQRQLSEVEAALQLDPNAQLNQQLADASAAEQQLSQQIRQVSGRYIAPEQMGALLQDVLAKQPQVQLIRLENLPAQVLQLPGAEPSSTTPTTQLYRHRTIFVFSGRYQALQQLLQQLEQLPWQLHWQQLQYQVTAHPLAELHLELETVSEQENYLRL
jgi:MSHA biogenesis protein MshJ